ncbi:MAG: Amuc_1100 family pilus-like protein [Spartobacteria bacterium]
MNWFRQNRFLGGFLVVLALVTVFCVAFLLYEKAAAEEEQARLESTIAELNRLRGSAPFPDAANLRKTRAQTESYRKSLFALEQELKRRMFPKPPLQPNEFQAQLRQSVNAVIDRARASKVQLPDNFNLGFDVYATSLPNSVAAPRLGRQLRAIEWLANTMVDAHVDAIQSFSRIRLQEETTASSPTLVKGRAPDKTTDEAGAKVADSTSVDVTFAGSPAAIRRVLNQVAAAKEQVYIIRLLRVRNQVDWGPKRGSAEAPPPAGAAGRSDKPGISFIVGTEHLNVAAKIEILRFNFPEKGVR